MQIDIPKGNQEKILNILNEKLPDYNLGFIAFKNKLKSSPYKDVVIENINYKKHPSGIIINKNINSKDFKCVNGLNYYIKKEEGNCLAFDEMFNVLELDYLNKLQEINNNIGNKHHPYKIPLDDKKTFKILCKGDSNNIFQFNTSSMSNILKEFSPSSIEDLSIINAMYRPGCLDVLDCVIENKKNSDFSSFENKTLNQLLSETYGVLVYQETFLLILNKFCGISYPEGEKWRKKLIKNYQGFKSDFGFMDYFYDKVKEKRILSDNDIGKLNLMIFNYIKSIFPKSHSLCYSIIGYWGAYYKANFRKEFEEVFK